MSAAILYVFGCIGFVLAAIGGLGLGAMFISDFEVSGVGLSARERSIVETGELFDYVKPAILFLAGLALFIAGWPA